MCLNVSENTFLNYVHLYSILIILTFMFEIVFEYFLKLFFIKYIVSIYKVYIKYKYIVLKYSEIRFKWARWDQSFYP